MPLHRLFSKKHLRLGCLWMLTLSIKTTLPLRQPYHRRCGSLVDLRCLSDRHLLFNDAPNDATTQVFRQGSHALFRSHLSIRASETRASNRIQGVSAAHLRRPSQAHTGRNRVRLLGTHEEAHHARQTQEDADESKA